MYKVVALLISVLWGCNKNEDLKKSNDMDTLNYLSLINLIKLNNSSVQDSLKFYFGDTLCLIKTDTITDEETGFVDVNFIYVDNKKDSILLKEILKRPNNVHTQYTLKKFSVRWIIL